MSWQPQAFSVVNNGHTIQANPPPGGVATSAGRKYELQQFHFHSPSEQRRRFVQIQKSQVGSRRSPYVVTTERARQTSAAVIVA